ncbi:uncharacterized protein LOC124152611 [Haliotis rufescens]|uniref:uncharacterized protein LOC124152611 n=1 Tax=Haliotis rufescens TaxID=6454 RepID=UPI00201F1643|nr:uncharacterized protein LOC124152611 [Haliotis rufescens]XP_048251043.1 uncharacterized protein LOC124152611 [Haliotis rufescens]XP_048251044.1 uncharacterized protein LOC124152611 [Haliotis rufescens]XP_048251045.1 uncharacterized protein LOC124152611 [Haliotis rufescens]
MNTSTTPLPLEAFALNLVRRLNMSATPGHTTPNSGLPPTESREEFFHHLTLKDETVFVALIVMGVIVPAIFISVFALICIRRHKEMKARKAAMLLRDAQDMAMEDYPYTMRGLTRFSHWRI